jgi:hypothetical protein
LAHDNRHWWQRFVNWRRYHHRHGHHHRHNHHRFKNEFFIFVEVDKMANAITIVLNDGLPHAAVAAVLNLDGSTATDVTVNWSSDNEAFVTIDPATGALTAVAAGVATITGTGVRGQFTHSDSATITVTSTAAGADFTLSVNAS